jgi:pyruvate dehydrogenase E2 component (dihydrolipoamide acetyltransferase)
MYEFKMPALGAEMTNGTLLEWKVKKGDRIKAHDIIAIIDTDKAAIEIESFRGGVVEDLIVNPGEKVPVGTLLAHIRESEEAKKAPESELKPPPASLKIKISPLARKLAQELNVDISKIQGTGPDGAIVEADIRNASSVKPTAVTAIADHSVSMQKAIAAAMSRSNREIPHYYLSYEIDLTKALNWLEKYNQEHPITERILYAALLIKAVALALKKNPQFNGFFINEEFKPSDSVHVGFAISLRGGGLIAPALLNADSLSLVETMNHLADLVARTRTGKLRGQELSDSTITITNLGDLGVDSVFGVIYPPQVALIGFGKITSRNTIIATLSADHRVSNGLLGSRLLTTINQLLQEPEKML